MVKSKMFPFPNTTSKCHGTAEKSQQNGPLIPEGINQIGCVHTSQGLEFEYVGVIIGNDLRYDPETGKLFCFLR